MFTPDEAEIANGMLREHHPPEDIAAVLGISQTAVRNKLRKTDATAEAWALYKAWAFEQRKHWIAYKKRQAVAAKARPIVADFERDPDVNFKVLAARHGLSANRVYRIVRDFAPETYALRKRAEPHVQDDTQKVLEARVQRIAAAKLTDETRAGFSLPVGDPMQRCIDCGARFYTAADLGPCEACDALDAVEM